MGPLEDIRETCKREQVVIRYRNHRGEVADRRIAISGLLFMEIEWHGEPQWILRAFDLDKRAERSFAMKDILAWRPYREATIPTEVPADCDHGIRDLEVTRVGGEPDRFACSKCGAVGSARDPEFLRRKLMQAMNEIDGLREDLMGGDA